MPESDSAQKSAAKSAKRPRLIPRSNGAGALLSGGVPGNKGGTGRPPNWLKDFCDELLADPKAKEQVEKIMQDRDHSAFAAMWKALADRAHGKPKESVELTGRDGGPIEQLWTFGSRKVGF